MVFLLYFSLCARPAGAGEADDLQFMVDRARSGATDLDTLDQQKVAKEEIKRLRGWLDEAWKLRNEKKYDEARVVLDRSAAQADMIRQKIEASKVLAQAAEKEKVLKEAKRRLTELKQTLNDAKSRKAVLEAKAK